MERQFIIEAIRIRAYGLTRLIHCILSNELTLLQRGTNHMKPQEYSKGQHYQHVLFFLALQPLIHTLVLEFTGLQLRAAYADDLTLIVPLI